MGASDGWGSTWKHGWHSIDKSIATYLALGNHTFNLSEDEP